MSSLDRIKSEVFSVAVKQGKFGDDIAKFIDFKIEENEKAEDQFASCIIFGEVFSETKDKSLKSFSVVIKVQHLRTENEAVRKSFNMQFYNEYLFYSEVLPFLKEEDSSGILDKYFPRFFFGLATNGEDPRSDILVFENLKRKGFKLANSRSFLDYDHIKISLESIAEFHSLSFVSRRKSPEKFKAIWTKILDPRWSGAVKGVDEFLSMNCRRGVLPLKGDPNYEEKVPDILSLLEKIVFLKERIIAPVEPLAVICHGDFCRNNMFFKYGSDGKPCAVKFFDLATCRYASPVIDLSFFLFLNTSPELKANHWEDFLQTYVSAFTSNPDLNVEDSMTVADLRQDFRRRGFYGYIHCSFFLPMMLVETEENWEEWKDLSFEEIGAIRVQTGGDVATNYVVQLVKHMIDKEFDFKYFVSVTDQS